MADSTATDILNCEASIRGVVRGVHNSNCYIYVELSNGQTLCVPRYSVTIGRKLDSYQESARG